MANFGNVGEFFETLKSADFVPDEEQIKSLDFLGLDNVNFDVFSGNKNAFTVGGALMKFNPERDYKRLLAHKIAVDAAPSFNEKDVEDMYKTIIESKQWKEMEQKEAYDMIVARLKKHLPFPKKQGAKGKKNKQSRKVRKNGKKAKRTSKRKTKRSKKTRKTRK